MPTTRIFLPGYTPGRRRPNRLPLPFGQVISPTGRPTSFAAGTPIVRGGPQTINLSRGYGVPSRFAAGFPSLTGGTRTGFQVIVGCTDVTKYLLAFGSSDTAAASGSKASPAAPTLTSQTIGRWTMQFDLRDPSMTYAPQVDQKVTFYDKTGVLLFAGFVNSAAAELVTGQQNVIWHVNCVDYSGICNHRVCGPLTFSAGSNISTNVTSLFAAYMYGEGITTNNVDPMLGDLVADETFYYTSVTQVLDQMASDAGAVWWVDANQDLHFVPLASLPACPISISATSNNFRGLVVTQTLLDYRNRQLASSNIPAIPNPSSSGSGPSTVAVTETYTLPQAGINPSLIFGTFATQLPISSVASLTLNGSPQTISDASVYAPGTWGWQFFPGNIYVWPVNATPMAGDVVVISYLPWIGPGGSGASSNIAVAVGDPLSVPCMAGSGIFDAVEQVKNISVLSDLQAIAVAVLARSGGNRKIVQFNTDFTGLQVGQSITVDYPAVGALNTDSFVVTSVQGVAQGPGVADLGQGSVMRYDVQAMTGQDIGNQIKWFERLVARTENPIPVAQYEEGTFILGPGGSLSSGAVNTNPYIASRSGALVDCVVAAATPPVGQDLVIDILRSTGGGTPAGIFPPGSQPVVLAGSTANTVILVTVFNTAYIYRNDVLTCSVSYRVHAGSTALAGSVTAKLRWSM